MPGCASQHFRQRNASEEVKMIFEGATVQRTIE